MQLKQLKLVGFKSFVDPTVLDFPSPLVAVVGPNGCGKSNIIDAIRWVMGESSAKHLRGESMADVIFNGSTHRKPVGQASVEIIFDNSLGRLGGPYAHTGEIAIKRIVTRQGDSTYYLNGTRCRRRDVLDLFLGTGAGVQGYSIISQGAVSKIIESKPEELRGYFEEAAGVSQYKERRRETLNRIQHTRENLVQVNFIREELSKQLQRLEKQTKAAQKYLQFKDQERLIRAQIIALKWQDLEKIQTQIEADLQILTLESTSSQLRIIDIEKQKDLAIISLQELEKNCQNIQASYYQSGSEIARLQENEAQYNREKQRLENDKNQLQMDFHKSDQYIKNHLENVDSLQIKSAQLSHQLEKYQSEIRETEKLYSVLKDQQIEKEKESQAVQLHFNTLKNDLNIAEVNSKNKEQRIQHLKLRLERLQSEYQEISIKPLQEKKTYLDQEVSRINEIQSQTVIQVSIAEKQRNESHEQFELLQQKMQVSQDDFQSLKIQYASLKAAQGAACSEEIWPDKARLVNSLSIAKEWQFAVECMLGDTLKAIVVDSNIVSLADIRELSLQGAQLISFSSHQKPNSANSIIDKFEGKIPETLYDLESILIAETLEEALIQKQHLKTGESILTREGYWIGQGWIRIPQLSNHEDIGLLVRQHRIDELFLQIQQSEKEDQNLRTQRFELQEKINHEKMVLKNVQEELLHIRESLRDCISQQKINEEHLKYSQSKSVLIQEEIQDLMQELEETLAEQSLLNEQQLQLSKIWKEAEQSYQTCLENQQMISTQLSPLKSQLQTLKADFQQITIEKERTLSTLQQQQEGIHNEQARLIIIQERIEDIVEKFIAQEAAQVLLKTQLESALSQYHILEQALKTCQEKLIIDKKVTEDLLKNIKENTQEKHSIDQKIIEKRLEEQATKMRIQALQDSLKEYSCSSSRDEQINLTNNLLGDLNDLTVDLQERALSVIIESIQRLGSINLAAIEEYAEANSRKENLDEQYQDLEEALSILETAIEKMDKETKMRLVNTFDEVNALFKSLFPRLFGGGRAALEWSSDNVLDAGIVVMAQPPGKRNSTIHLLSGGEKAMTAIALVFAIFQLNPSPFCMLDEVDAPLDDANVVRFCSVVKEMSKFVQFLFITHNKVTMEAAKQLIGVTMREPGVSRLVTVDINVLTLE